MEFGPPPPLTDAPPRTAPLSRREFLVTLSAGAMLATCGTALGAPKKTKGRKIGIALGGGGARGLAHVLMLEALEELGVTPHRIAGTSMGAVVGALYASGLTADAIRTLFGEALRNRNEHGGFIKKEILEWIDLADPAIGRGGILDSSDFIAFVHQRIQATSFAGLKIPLRVVAADVRRREQVVLESGDLPEAIRASTAFPGLFTPVVAGGRVLVDGGTVNPVPYDVLLHDCDITIAVDVAGRRTATGAVPGFFETLFDSFQTMEKAILNGKMRYRPPDIYIKPDLLDIRLLDFAKDKEIYQQAAPAKEELKKALKRLLA